MKVRLNQLKILALNWLALLPLVLVLWGYVLPRVEELHLNAKKDAARSAVDAAISILESHQRDVDRGRLSLEEAKARAKETLRRLRFLDGNYVFVFSMEGRLVLQPIHPEREGDSVQQITDPTGKRFAVELIDGAARGEDRHVRYLQPRPVGGAEVRKLSFARLYRPWGWVVGAGLYLDDVESDISALEERILLWVGVAVALSLAVSLLFARLLRTLERRRQSANSALATEIIEKRRIEAELEQQRALSVHSARMSALGEMAGGIAHEINNPLAIIRGTLSVMEKLMAAKTLSWEQASGFFGRIDGCVTRISRIIAGLRAFSRDASQDPFSWVPLRQVIEETLELCRHELLKHAIRIEVDAGPEDLAIECRPVQISQILLNLISNARDAVRDRPSPWIRIVVEDLGPRVRIAVTDNGPGIPPEVRDKIMQPFFSTKPVGQGVGLGLSISQGLAESHSGRLECSSEGPITRFLLTLPKTQDEARTEVRAMIPSH